MKARLTTTPNAAIAIGIKQSAQGDTGDRGDRGPRRRDQPAKDAVADVIGQRHRGVADARREQLDQECGDRAVHHRHQDHQVEHQDASA